MEDCTTWKFQVEFDFFSSTPVADLEFSPRAVRVKSLDNSDKVPPHVLKFTWYSEQTQCSVHVSKIARLQCLLCLRLNLPDRYSYHCTSECFLDDWPRHRATHSYLEKTSGDRKKTLEELKDCLSLPLCNVGSLHSGTPLAVKRVKSWIKVGSSDSYTPTHSDVGSYLRLKCTAVDAVTGIQLTSEKDVRTLTVIEAPIGTPRTVIDVNRNNNPGDMLAPQRNFKVLSYNILADLYAITGRFDYCPSWAILWPYRRKNLLQEIIGYDADIICLQEVQSDHYEDYIKPKLIAFGYSAIYKKKNNELYTPKQYVIDGCATFYRQNKFTEIKKYELDFTKTAKYVVDAMEETQKREGAIRLMKDNVAIIVILETLQDDKSQGVQHRVCVANTHLLANSNFPDVKCFQVSQLLRGLQVIAQLRIPIILCGDMNSLPWSDPYKLVVNGKLDSYGHGVDPLKIYQHLDLHHSLRLASAYSSLLQSVYVEECEKSKMSRDTMEPHFTHWSKRSCGTLDYIFYQVNSLVVESILELLDKNSLGEGIPSPLWSSDHIALMAKFNFRLPPISHYPQLPFDPWGQFS